MENGADTTEMTIVYWASSGWLEKVKESIESGADVYHKSRYGDTALDCAYEKGYIDIVKLLLKNGADGNQVKVPAPEQL